MRTRVGIIGTGFIGQGLARLVAREADMQVSAVLTRRDLDNRLDHPTADKLTGDPAVLLAESELIVDCSGDVVYATEVIDAALSAGVPVVTLNAALQVTTGSYFARKGLFTEAEGDQPGSLAALREQALNMGFKPLVYGNIKGFLNETPALEDMRYWSRRNGLSLDMTVSFTDGTKLQLEQALVANGLGADIAAEGLLGLPASGASEGGSRLAEAADRLGRPISDYILSPTAPAGVFVTCTHEETERAALRYYKMGEGPYYTLLVNYHLCHLEMLKTIRRVVRGDGVLLNNSERPAIGVAAIAKRRLAAGTTIERGIGGFDVRGSAVRLLDRTEHVPIGLLDGAVLRRPLEVGQLVTFADVHVQQSRALRLWLEIRDRVLSEGGVSKAVQ